VQPEVVLIEEDRVILHLVGDEVEVTREKEEKGWLMKRDRWHVCEAPLQILYDLI
jgi:hypothetical protein